MSDTVAGRRSDAAGDRPAIGLVASAGDAEAVAGTILRADREGHDVFVVHRDDSELEAVRFAERLGATVLAADDPEAGHEELLATAGAVARERGYPALLRCRNPDERIDHAASREAAAASDDYVVDAATTDATGDRDVLIAIPAYDEAGTIADVVAAARPRGTVLVIDDGSSDDTADRAREAGAEVVAHAENRGYGAALATAFEEARDRRVEDLVILDGDGQHDPGDVERLLAARRDGDADVVIGSRFLDGADGDLPLYRRFGIGVVNVLTNLSMGRPRSGVSDAQSGFRAYGPAAIASLAEADIDANMGASTDILHHVRREGLDVAEVPVDVSYDVEDPNSQNPVAHGLGLVNNLLRTVEQDHPILVFGLPGLASVLLSFGFAYWSMHVYVSNDSFPVGLALLATVFGLVGLLSCFTAVILHSLQRHFSRRDGGGGRR